MSSTCVSTPSAGVAAFLLLTASPAGTQPSLATSSTKGVSGVISVGLKRRRENEDLCAFCQGAGSSPNGRNGNNLTSYCSSQARLLIVKNKS